MTPGAVIHDERFGAYLAIVAGVLAAAGAVLAVLRFALRRDVGAVWATYRSWLVIVPVIVLAVVLGSGGVVALFALLAAAGFGEFARASGLARDRWMCGAVCVAIAATAASVLFQRFEWFMAMPALAVAMLVLLPIARNEFEGQLRAIALAAFAFVYLGWMLMHAAWLGQRPQTLGHLFFLLLAVELNDVAAFTLGKLAGRHPLRGAISPKKTWEGAAGALAVSMLLPWAMRPISFPQFGPKQLVLTGLIVGVGGQLGDLSLSVIKRDLAVKDMGGTIPGHGGVLDRIDSLLYTSPLFVHMVNHYFHYW